MKARELQHYIGSQVPVWQVEEGFRFGDPDAEVTGILVCWMITLQAIERAITEGCNLILTHEDLFYPYNFQRADTLEPHLHWAVNRHRISALARGGLTVFRAHGALDRICIFDDFAALLDLGEPERSDGVYGKVYRVLPTSMGEVAARVKQCLGLATVRTCGDPCRRVSLVGLPWGGMGLSLNIGYVNSLLEMGSDLLIAGETDEYAMRYVLDAGAVMIETGHALSEEPGLSHFAERLRQQFPGVKVVFVSCGPAWRPL